jgi:hypothetical protein
LLSLAVGELAEAAATVLMAGGATGLVLLRRLPRRVVRRRLGVPARPAATVLLGPGFSALEPEFFAEGDALAARASERVDFA